MGDTQNTVALKHAAALIAVWLRIGRAFEAALLEEVEEFERNEEGAPERLSRAQGPPRGSLSVNPLAD